MKKYKPVVLVILDGWGETDEQLGNPIKKANLPTIEKLNQHYPKTLCQASGLAVGLPWGVCGNSEVGHQTLGTGQIIYQNLPVISLAIKNRSFFKNKTLLEGFRLAQKNNKKVHILGLLSDGAVHSHLDHILALLEMAKEQQAEKVFLHLISDGRDVPPKSFKKYFQQLEEKMKEQEVGRVATLSGRFYTMDRNNNWERTEKAYRAMILGEGVLVEKGDLLAQVEKQYEQGITDEFLPPLVMTDDTGSAVGKIEEGDVVIFANFRKDRARQISAALLAVEEKKFSLKAARPKVELITFANYDEKLSLKTVFTFPQITAYLGEDLAKAGKKQLRIAETEKYAHVTYFFNGGIEKPFPGEDRILIESKKVASYDQAPEMSAREITSRLEEALIKEQYDFILVNYANPDMVGHTGNLAAAVKALEETDRCLEDLIKSVLEKDGCLLVTADHGNVEEMVNLRNGEIDTEHSLNPVPFWLVCRESYLEKKENLQEEQAEGMIMDIPVTILELLGMKKNPRMEGTSLLDLLGFSFKK